MKPHVRNFILYFVICQILLAVTNWPFYVHRVVGVPAGKVSPMVHGGHVDYFTYIGFIRESKDGAWQIPALYTSEPTQKTSVYVFYILLGKIAKIFNLSPISMYHIARIFSAELFFLSIYFVVSLLVSPPLVLASCVMGLFSTVPLLFGRIALWDQTYAKNWWYNLDPLFRADYVPHHHIALACAFVAVGFWIRFVRSKKSSLLVGTSVLSFLASVIYPTSGLICAPAIGSYFLSRKVWRQKTMWTAGVVGMLSILVGLLLVRFEAAKGFPWDQWLSWDIIHWNAYPHFSRDFVVAAGFTGILAIPAFAAAVRRWHIEDRIIVIWTVLPYVILPFVTTLGLATIRLGFLANFIPFGILAVGTVKMGIDRISNKGMKNIVTVLMTLVLTGLFFPTTMQYYQSKEAQHAYGGPEFFLTTGEYEGITYLSTHVNDHSVVLSTGAIGLMIPAYGNLISCCSHPVHTKNYDEKNWFAQRFFGGVMTPDEAKTFIASNRISYLFMGPQEHLGRGDIMAYGISFTVLWSNDTVTIYRVFGP